MSRQASGLRAWIFQRVTAIALLLYFPYLILSIAFGPPATHAEWVAWLSQPLVGMGFLIFVGLLLLHAWVGVRDAIIDYVHPTAIRVTALSLLALGLIGCGLWALKVIVLVG
ncbi:MAG: succinate dehydrogenase, hydrophobic membrane anchor protein [Chromatiaceae bacterium]